MTMTMMMMMMMMTMMTTMMTNDDDNDDDNEFMSFFNRYKGMKRNFPDTSDADLVVFFFQLRGFHGQ